MDGIVIVDKPQDWTSQDVVSKLRGCCAQGGLATGEL